VVGAHGPCAGGRPQSELRMLLVSCPFLIAGDWGLYEDMRSWLRRDWVRRSPASAPEVPVLWERVGDRGEGSAGDEDNH
jgi:hypothetical protein